MHRSTVQFLLCVPLVVWGYEAPEDQEDVFARTACPAFLTFTNTAYVSGATVELPCLCKPPEVLSVVWFYRKHLSSSEQTQALFDDHGLQVVDPESLPHSSDLRSRFSIRLFSLLVFRSSPAHSGVYICGSEHRDFFYAYDLDIQEARRITFTDRLGKKETLEETRRQSNSAPLYRTFTSFQAWSVCDRCGRPGEQVRVGLCYVHSLYLHVRYRRANQTVAPCGSGAVLRVFGPINNEGAVLEVRDCEELCPPQAPPPSKVTSLMAFLGYGSASKPLGVKVYYLTHQADTTLIIGCPGAKPNMAVAWDREDTPILRRGHTAPPGGEAPRISIDTGHNLVFNLAQVQDSGVYYCWLQGRRTAQIRLIVHFRLGQGQSVLSHPHFYPALWMVVMWYAGMSAVFLLFLLTKAVVQTVTEAHETHQD
ncbi:Ig-like V-type domain-containing protein FAM187A [Periophthalmus magnuspinnatus]|uniref:Ig-like V-type domain-containing protein FAM187A n=1 Tax=Periophthalmus magnuspinnatus TaxID=409849 RepID=UPI002436A0F6|nr:Ig-like V-type domain-containing protein FAM187A [Periophthalmus magnuspinnatus]